MIFPEKWVFDGKEHHTTKVNEAALLIYNINNKLRHKKTGAKSFENLNSGKVLEPVLNSHTFLNDLAELATISEFLNSTNLGRDFKRKYQRKYTDQESKKRPLSVIWQEAGLKFYDSKNR